MFLGLELQELAFAITGIGFRVLVLGGTALGFKLRFVQQPRGGCRVSSRGCVE